MFRGSFRGEAWRIHVWRMATRPCVQSTFDALSASHQRLFEDGRRDVEVKGKGTMTTYRFNVMRDRLPCDMQFCDAELSGSLDR